MTLAALLCSAVMGLSIPNAEYACRYMNTLVEEAQAKDLDPEIIIALIHEESRWKAMAESRSGACGLMQVLPKYTRPHVSCKNLKKPKISLREGTKALSYWVYEYAGGNYEKGLCGYNGGYKCGKRSKQYARRVMRLAKKLNEQVGRRRAYQDTIKELNLQMNVIPPEKK